MATGIGLGLRTLEDDSPASLAGAKPVSNEVMVTKDKGRLVAPQVGDNGVMRPLPFLDEVILKGSSDPRGISRIANKTDYTLNGVSGASWGDNVVLSQDGTKALVSASIYNGLSSGEVVLIDLLTGLESAPFIDSNKANGDQFGSVIAANPDFTRVAIAKGAVRELVLFSRSGDTIQEIQIITDTNYFVSSVDFSADGTVLAVGYAQADQAKGRVDVYKEDAGSYSLYDSLSPSDLELGDKFGGAVSLFGSSLLVGAPSALIAGVSDAGSAYVFGDNSTEYVETQKIALNNPLSGDCLGCSVQLRQDVLFLGAKGRTYTPEGGSPEFESGAVIVATRESSNPFNINQELQSSLVGPYGRLGGAVTASEDGRYLFAGAVNSSANANLGGAVVIFELTDGTFKELTPLVPALMADNAAFGGSLSSSADGQKLIVGSKGSFDNVGGFTVFDSGTDWRKTLYEITLDDLVNGRKVEGVLSADILSEFIQMNSTGITDDALINQIERALGGTDWKGKNGEPPKALFTVSESITQAPVTITVSDASEAGDNDIVSRVLSFSDGRDNITMEAATADFVITDINQTVDVTLRVEDSVGNFDEFLQTVKTTDTFRNIPPVINNQVLSVEAGQDKKIVLGPVVDSDNAQQTLSYTFSGNDNVVAGPASNEITFNSTVEGQQTINVSVSDGVDTDDAIITINVLAVGSITTPLISEIAPQFTALNTTLVVQPSLNNTASAGTVMWFKAYGPDEVSINPVTGEIRWDTARVQASESFHIGIKCINKNGSQVKDFIAHVGKTEQDVIYIGPSETYTAWDQAQPFVDGGKTVVFRNGTYGGEENIIGRTYDSERDQYPASGDAGRYTCIMAESVGEVSFVDGTAGVRFALWNGGKNESSYIKFGGFFFDGGSTLAITGDPTDKLNTRPSHFKMIFCGGAGTDYIPLYARVADFILFESCYAFGGGRYKISTNECTNVRMIRCIARYDRSDRLPAQDPKGSIICYNTMEFIRSNCIAIDDVDRLVSSGYKAGAYGTPVTSTSVTPTGSKGRDVRCLQLNSEQIHCQYDYQVSSGGGASDVEVVDMVAYDIRPHNHGIYSWGATHWDRCSFIKFNPFYEPEKGSFNTGDYNQCRGFTNCVIHDFPAQNGPNLLRVLTTGSVSIPYNGGTSRTVEKYGFLNNNLTEWYGTQLMYAGGQTESGTTTVDISPHLKYVPRIEPDSAVQESHGGEVMYMFGRSGAHFGEAGYDEETDIPMWPFPLEDVIREKFAAWSHTGETYTGEDYLNRTPAATETLLGARGCAVEGGSISNYVWGYIGNTVPPLGVYALAGDAQATVGWLFHPSNDKTNLTEFKVYDYDPTDGSISNPRTVAADQDRVNVAGLKNGFDSHFVVTAVDSVKGESGFSYPVTVRPNGVITDPPVISFHPVSVEAISGDQVAFNVAGEGYTGIQWLENGSEIQDATGTQVIVDAQVAKSGNTYVARLDSPVSPVSSNAATLTVYALDSTPPSVSISLNSDVLNITLSDDIYPNDRLTLQLLDGGSPVGAEFSGSVTSIDLTTYPLSTGARTLTLRATDPQSNQATSSSVTYTVGSPVFVDDFADATKWSGDIVVASNVATINTGSAVGVAEWWASANKASVKFDMKILEAANIYEAYPRIDIGISTDGSTRLGCLRLYLYPIKTNGNSWVAYVTRAGSEEFIANISGWGNAGNVVSGEEPWVSYEVSLVGTNVSIKADGQEIFNSTLPEDISPFSGTMKITANADNVFLVKNMNAYA